MVNEIEVGDYLGTVQLDGKWYRHIRLKGNALSYNVQYSDEPPWEKGSQPLISDPVYSWHLGGFKSQPGIPSTSEYGRNSDGRFPFRLLPAGFINTLTLTGSVSPPTSIFEALGFIWVCAGRFVYRINPTTFAVTQSKDFGAAVNSVMGLRWENDFGIVCTDEATNSLYTVTATGTPDTWNTSNTSQYRLAAGINRLFGISKVGILRNISTTLSPTVDANWADSVQIGDRITPPNALVAYDRTVVVGKAEGLFGVGEEGFGIPLIRRMVRDASNCFGATNHDPWVLIPHVRGLYRWQPSLIASAGLEVEVMNQSPVRGRVTAIVPDGDWVYAAVDVGSDIYIMAGRERKSGEQGFGPMVWDTWLYLPGAATCNVLFISSLTATPTLFFGNGNNLNYVTLSAGGGAPDVNGSDYRFAQSGSRFTAKYRFTDWGAKDFPKAVVVVKNVDANNYWTVNYSIDGGAFSNLDVNNAAMNAQTPGRTTFFLPTTASGREIQYRLDFVANQNVTPPELDYFEPFAIPRPRRVPLQVFHLLLESNLRHPNGVDPRTSLEQFTDLQTLLTRAQSIVAAGPWGSSEASQIARLRLLGAMPQTAGNIPPGLLVEVTLQERQLG